jgi:hypothetical protein
MSNFGRLNRIQARTGWPNEAADFTPWLAQNLDRLEEALGLPLVLTATEQRVGRYSLDLLMEDSRGRVVIAENQFGRTDHDHLGKLLTYCAGTEAQVLIWIAESFTEEHLAALQLLNTNSVEEVGFFAVELELLQISDSPLAPNFRVLVQPNDWAKRVRPQSPSIPEQWNWDLSGDLGVPEQEVEIGRALADLLYAEIERGSLPWKPVFRKGYVAFQRPGGYNVFVVDVYWKKTPRLALKVNCTTRRDRYS